MFEITQYIEYDKNYNIVYYCEKNSYGVLIYWERFYYNNQNQIEYSENSNNVKFEWRDNERVDFDMIRDGSYDDNHHDYGYDMPDEGYDGAFNELTIDDYVYFTDGWKITNSDGSEINNEYLDLDLDNE